MKQLLQSLKTGETYIEDVPIPSPGPGFALVRTAASVISAGTERMVVDFARKSLAGKARARPDLVRQFVDKARREGFLTALDAARTRLDRPMPLGYSSAGTVVALGEGLQRFKVGDRVACGGGGWAVHAEYAVVPQNLLAPVPDGVPFEQAAFATLGAIALHGFRLSGAGLGEQVAVIGLGLLGRLAAAIAGAAGCRVLGVDLDPERVAAAEAAGLRAVGRDAGGETAEETAAAFTAGYGFDAVLICADTTSDDPVELAGEIARDRATVVAIGAVGQRLPRRTYFAKELTFLNSRSYGPGRYDPEYEEKGRDYPIGYIRWTEGRNLSTTLDLLAAGAIDLSPLITHRFPLDRAPEAYRLIRGEEPFLGVVLTYADQAPLKVESSRISGKTAPAVGTLSTSNLQPSTLNLGVIGAGNFATAVMLPAIRGIEGIERVGIASVGGLNAGLAARKFGFRYSTGDPAELLTDPEIDTIAVLTRHDSHAAHVLAALAAGKHVFCEKPLAVAPDELDAIEAACLERPDLRLAVGFNRRFAPLARRLAGFLGDGPEPFHAVYRVNAGYLPPDHWTQDPAHGGRIVGEACHFVDFLTFLAGAPPLDATAHGLPDGGRYREDNVQLTFTFPDGSIGTVVYLANGDRTVPKERLEVFSGGRVAVLDDFRSLALVRDRRKQVLRSRLRQDKGHTALWVAFAAAIAGGTSPIPLDQVFGVTRATFAAVRSLRIGARVEVAAVSDGGWGSFFGAEADGGPGSRR
ncbi:MAG TPA: bi-domain-containing oxidoreductase [Anaerolineales bacterium]|nr:bi-domain-containing oxidoreductase [Anaerolineales bacterium]